MTMTFDLSTLGVVLGWAGSLIGLVWYLSRQFGLIRESVIRIEGVLSRHDDRITSGSRRGDANDTAHVEMGRRIEDAGNRITRLEAAK